MGMVQPWKHTRTGVYYFRRRVPEDCRPVVGKTEWRKSLGTKSKREAYALIAAHIAESDEAIRSIRNGTYRRYSDEEVESWAMLWAREYLHDFEAEALLPPPRPHEVDVAGPSGPLCTQEELEASVRRFLEENRERIDIAEGSRDWIALLLAAQQEHYSSFVTPQPVAELHIGGFRATVTKSDVPSLKEVMDRYLDEASVRGQTRHDYQSAAERFAELIEDKPIGAITKADARQFRDQLKRVPCRAPTSLRKQGLARIIKWADETETERLSAPTINKALAGLRACMSWAIDQTSLLPDEHANPFSGIAVADRRQQSEKRLPFTTEDLAKIFTNLPDADAGPADHWLPLLAAYTGARLEELGQLQPSDVRQDGSIWVLSFTDADDQSKQFKTAGSRRVVPIHPVLIARGFLEFSKKRADKMWLFDLKPNRFGSRTQSYSKRFSRLRTDLEISKLKTFHSFRHAWKQAAQSALVPEEVAEAIQGHSGSQRVSRAVYGTGLRTLAQVLDHYMRRISYEEAEQQLLAQRPGE